MPTQPTLRRTLLSFGAVALLSASLPVSAWSWSWGDGEKVSGDGKTLRETRAVAGFDGVRVGGDFEVVVRQSATAKLEVEGDANLLPYVETKVVETSRGKSLEIGVRRGYNIQGRKPIRVEIDMPSLRAVSITGSGKTVVEAFKAKSVDLSISGAGEINALQMQADKLGLSIAGSGDILAGGRATSVDVSIAGSGDVKAADLAADEVEISIAGSGNAAVQATKKLDVSIAGSGDVRYSGDAVVKKSVAGSGSIKKI